MATKKLTKDEARRLGITLANTSLTVKGWVADAEAAGMHGDARHCYASREAKDEAFNEMVYLNEVPQYTEGTIAAFHDQVSVLCNQAWRAGSTKTSQFTRMLDRAMSADRIIEVLAEDAKEQAPAGMTVDTQFRMVSLRMEVGGSRRLRVRGIEVRADIQLDWRGGESERRVDPRDETRVVNLATVRVEVRSTGTGMTPEMALAYAAALEQVSRLASSLATTLQEVTAVVYASFDWEREQAEATEALGRR